MGTPGMATDVDSLDGVLLSLSLRRTGEEGAGCILPERQFSSRPSVVSQAIMSFNKIALYITYRFND
jgi:hypothetical protein